MKDTMMWGSRERYIFTLGVASLASLAFYLFSVLRLHGFFYDYLPINLILAWIPFLLTLRLSSVLKHKLWSSWEALILSLLWLLFLPNAFYMVSDFIHLQTVPANDIGFDAVMFALFINVALALGYS